MTRHTHVDPRLDALCAICGQPFTSEEWDVRHDGFEYDDELHEPCCLFDGPCAPPILGPPRPKMCPYREQWPQMACSLWENHLGDHLLYHGAWTSDVILWDVDWSSNEPDRPGPTPRNG